MNCRAGQSRTPAIFRINRIPKNGSVLFSKNIFRHSNYFLSHVATVVRIEMDWNLKRLDQLFQVYAMPAKITKKLSCLVLSDEIFWGFHNAAVSYRIVNAYKWKLNSSQRHGTTTTSSEVRVLLDTKPSTGKPNRVVLRSLYVERNNACCTSCVIAHWVRATRAKTKKVKIRGCCTVLLAVTALRGRRSG